MLSKKASSDSHGQDSSYFLGWEAYKNNPYHQLHNPSGIIQMGLAENQLCFDLLDSWLASNKEALEMKRNGESLFKELALFQDYHGLPDTKNELVQLMAKIRGNKVKLDPSKLVLIAGSTAANETLMFCLADLGEAFLLPTPYYPGFDRDLKWRTGVEIVPIHSSSSNGFRITISALEEAYEQAQKLKLKVKGVLVTNPSNPLGTTLTRQELNHLITFAIAKKIHIVSDEIYSGTVFDSSPNSFLSIMEAVMDRNIDESDDLWSRIHTVYSLSKDFSMPGFRIGMIYTNNETVVSASTKMSSFGLVSSQTQFLTSSLISDKKFTRKFLKENRKRLVKRKEMLVSGLKASGIKCLKSNAGLFCWVDMRQLLVSNTFEAEEELWKNIIFDVGLNISPGFSFHCSEPGWFRICFANISEETLQVALHRIKAFTQSHLSSLQLLQRRSIIGKWVSKLSAAASYDHEPHH